MNENRNQKSFPSFFVANPTINTKDNSVFIGVTTIGTLTSIKCDVATNGKSVINGTMAVNGASERINELLGTHLQKDATVWLKVEIWDQKANNFYNAVANDMSKNNLGTDIEVIKVPVALSGTLKAGGVYTNNQNVEVERPPVLSVTRFDLYYPKGKAAIDEKQVKRKQEGQRMSQTNGFQGQMSPAGYPAPQQGGYPAPQQGGYPAPQQGGYPVPQQGGYPAPQQGGYPAPQQGGYPAPQQGGYQAPQKQGGYSAPAQAPAAPAQAPAANGAWAQNKAPAPNAGGWQNSQAGGFPQSSGMANPMDLQDGELPF